MVLTAGHRRNVSFDPMCWCHNLRAVAWEERDIAHRYGLTAEAKEAKVWLDKLDPNIKSKEKQEAF